MDKQRFLIGERIFPADDPRLQEALSLAYGHSARPKCLCIPDGIEMYVARHHLYVVKRMPGTGGRHYPACPSFEPDAQQSGLGELMGEAIIETESGTVELRVGFPWRRLAHPGSARRGCGELGEVLASRRRMSLRALTHYLFERAGLNQHSPATVKPHQGVLEKNLYAAAAEMTVQGGPLSERLYIPEPFNALEIAAIASRRRKRLAFLQPKEGQFQLAVVLGEFKSCEATISGHRVFIKHMPDAPLLVANNTWARIEKTYAGYFEARDADAGLRPRLVLTALIRARRELTYEIDAASLMLTSEHWIPVEGIHELPLIQSLVEQRRRFIKPLRYDARTVDGFANALLLDAGTAPIPLHIVSPFMTDAQRKAKEEAIAAYGDNGWVWYTDETMPPFMTAKIKDHQCQ